ncbi:hypothetical protein [Planotetraspora sp. GP83]|uniref:hypothetical protein n=1 Tax=Planotetraspora sp. GP83 TaxID=3156264 RepID=UPI003517452F
MTTWSSRSALVWLGHPVTVAAIAVLAVQAVADGHVVVVANGGFGHRWVGGGAGGPAPP